MFDAARTTATDDECLPNGPVQDPPKRRRMRCGGCGEVGHSKLTCPNADAPITRKGTVTCSTCNQPGHNSRKCPLKPRNTSVTCSSCGAVGHNCRTCPMKGSRKRQAVGDETPMPRPAQVCSIRSETSSQFYVLPSEVYVCLWRVCVSCCIPHAFRNREADMPL
jgi:hypothetical protein